MKVPSGWAGASQPTPATASAQIGNLSYAQLTKMLQSNFLPASIGTAPLAAPGSGGNRTRVVTTGSPYVSSLNGQTGALSVPPIQVTMATLVAGTYTWTFPTPFNSPPVVVAIPIGAPPTSGTANTPASIYAGTPTKLSCAIQSTFGSDVRQVMIVACGNPS